MPPFTAVNYIPSSFFQTRELPLVTNTFSHVSLQINGLLYKWHLWRNSDPEINYLQRVSYTKYWVQGTDLLGRSNWFPNLFEFQDILTFAYSTRHLTNFSFLGSTAQSRPWPPPQNPAQFLGGFSTIFFFTGRVVSPTHNHHPGGPGLCIYIPQRQSGYPF
jgi:hypothetical protein